MLNCTNCYFHGDEITFNSDMTVNIYNKVQDSNWCDLKYLKGKTDKSMGNYKDLQQPKIPYLDISEQTKIQ